MRMYKETKILEPTTSRRCDSEEIMDEVLQMHRKEADIFPDIRVYTHFVETIFRKTGEVRRYKTRHPSGTSLIAFVYEEDWEATLQPLQESYDEMPDNRHRTVDLESFRDAEIKSEEETEMVVKLVVYFQ